jgi:[ribosomal protein S5]-alanine N-acetyltransferase
MKNYIIETARCRLREMNTGDAAAIYALNLHPDIFRFTTDPPFESEKKAFDFIKNYDAYSKTGFGRWAVELRSNGEFIGWCGLKYHPEENEVDVGYRLLPQYWGNGYAAETAIACCKWGFEKKGLTRIVARVHKENHRSIRVAEKMNMLYEKDLIYDGIPWMNFVVSANIL